MVNTVQTRRMDAARKALVIGMVSVAMWVVGMHAGRKTSAPVSQQLEALSPPRPLPADEERSQAPRAAHRQGSDNVSQIDVPSGNAAERDAREWQGMLVNTAISAQVCRQSTDCGRALSCTSRGRCGACQGDSECGSGETCVLQHCLIAEKTTCHSFAECAAGAVCIIVGNPVGPRGNAELTTACSNEIQDREEPAPPPVAAPPDATSSAAAERMFPGPQLRKLLDEAQPASPQSAGTARANL